MASDLQRIAQGLLEYLDENPRMAAELKSAADQCLELAASVAELAALIPAAAGAAHYLDAAANSCDEAAQLAAGASARGRAWALSAVGSEGATATDASNRNPATSIGGTPVETPRSAIDAGPSVDDDDAVASGREDSDDLDSVTALENGTGLQLDSLEMPSVEAEESPPAKYSLDTKLDEHSTARDVVQRYDPEKANLPPMTAEEALEYIAANKDARPWLAPAADCDAEVQRIYATLDMGMGHAHHRHDGMGDDELYERRVAYLEDPAQTDPLKRAKSEDAFKPGTRHRCDAMASRISDPRAFAAAIAAGLENPEVSACLSMPVGPGTPRPVELPIDEVLGRNGHEFCRGARLEGDPVSAKVRRKDWVNARAAGESLDDKVEPTCEPVPTFEGGSVEYWFRKNNSGNGYELNTIVIKSL